MTLHVSYRALTPERAATIVNAHIDSYQNFGVKTKMEAAERANSALTAQVAELRQQLLAAEAAVTRYREEHHLTGAARDAFGAARRVTQSVDLAPSRDRGKRSASGRDWRGW